MKFRKKPVVIEAVEWTGLNDKEVAIFLAGRTNDRGRVTQHRVIVIPTLEGNMTVNVGDWIIKGIKGEFYPCKPDIFEQTYELVENGLEN